MIEKVSSENILRSVLKRLLQSTAGCLAFRTTATSKTATAKSSTSSKTTTAETFGVVISAFEDAFSLFVSDFRRYKVWASNVSSSSSASSSSASATTSSE